MHARTHARTHTRPRARAHMRTHLQCLDVKDGGSVAGTPLQMWQCFSDNHHQRFIMTESMARTRARARARMHALGRARTRTRIQIHLRDRSRRALSAWASTHTQKSSTCWRLPSRSLPCVLACASEPDCGRMHTRTFVCRWGSARWLLCC